mgnify:CR=1 FL=1
MPVSKKRKTIKKTGRKFGVTKRMPNVQSLLFKYIHAYFDESISEYVVYVNLVCNDVPVIMSGFIDLDKSYFEGIRLHNPKPKKGHTAQTVYISKKDAPMFFATIKAYSHTVADLLDEGGKVPLLDINNGGKYFTDKSIEDYRVLK